MTISSETAEPATVKTEHRERVFCMEMHRPAKKNALDSLMYELLIQGFQQAESDPEVHVILLHGGPNCFTSGSDLQEFKRSQEDGIRGSAGEKFLHTISRGHCFSLMETVFHHESDSYDSWM